MDRVQILEEVLLDEQGRTEINRLIGIVERVENPYNIYVRLSDLMENQPILHFVIYSFGKKNALMWGLYDRTADPPFQIADACRIRQAPTRYYRLLLEQYVSAGDVTVDRRKDLPSYESNATYVTSYYEYVRYKTLLSWLDGTIDLITLQRLGFEPMTEDDYYSSQENPELGLTWEEFLSIIENEVLTYEQTINLGSRPAYVRDESFLPRLAVVRRDFKLFIQQPGNLLNDYSYERLRSCDRARFLEPFIEDEGNIL